MPPPRCGDCTCPDGFSGVACGVWPPGNAPVSAAGSVIPAGTFAAGFAGPAGCAIGEAFAATVAVAICADETAALAFGCPLAVGAIPPAEMDESWAVERRNSVGTGVETAMASRPDCSASGEELVERADETGSFKSQFGSIPETCDGVAV